MSLTFFYALIQLFTKIFGYAITSAIIGAVKYAIDTQRDQELKRLSDEAYDRYKISWDDLKKDREN